MVEQEIARRRRDNAALPVQRLPEEIISEILLLAGPISHTSAGRTSPFNACDVWRDIALKTTPRLWTRFSLALRPCRQPDLEGIRAWLARSKALPLEVDIEADRRTYFSEAELKALLEAIAPALLRCRTLHIFTADKDEVALFDALVSLPVTSPYLHSVHLVCNGDGDDSAWHDAPVTLVRASSHPTIQSLHIRLRNQTGAPLTICVDTPWAQLRYLNLYFQYPFEEVHKILRNAPNLETLYWDSSIYPDKSDREKWENDPVHLPNLTFLHLENAGALNFLHLIDAPALRTLSLMQIFEDDDVFVYDGHLTLFPCLDELALRFGPDRDFTLAFLRSHPTIRTLKTQWNDAAADLLLNVERICPALRTLYIRMEFTITFDPAVADVISDAVRAYLHLPSTTPLKLVLLEDRPEAAYWSIRARKIAGEFPERASVVECPLVDPDTGRDCTAQSFFFLHPDSVPHD